MFPDRYFALRFYANRYFPKGGIVAPQAAPTGYVFEYGRRIILWDVLEQLAEDDEWLLLT